MENDFLMLFVAIFGRLHCSFCRLSLENLLQVRSFASSFLCSGLVGACDRIIHENFERLATSPAFYAALSGPEFCKLIESDDLQVSSMS